MKLLSSLFLIFSSLFSYSQNVGIGTTTPHASAALEVKDSTKGILIPRMTMAQRNAIQNPAEGLMVYQTDSSFGFWYWGRGQWRNFRSSNNNDSLAVVTTNSSTAISYTTATLNANIISNGGEMILLRGFFLDTVPLQTINNIVVTGNNTGNFSYNSSGLIPGKKYFVRAFATNANGTAVGDTVSFTTNSLTIPTLTTDLISNVTNNGATCGGNITNDGGSFITNRGVCYGTSPNPTISNSISVSGTGTGAFLTSLSGLNSSVTYYVRAYATNAIGTAYGEQRSFTTVTLSVPTISTDQASTVSYTSVVSGITVTNTGGSNITSQGICYSTTANPTIANSRISTVSGLGHYNITITGLTPNTNYYARAYSTNSSGTAYGNQIVFSTLALSLPVISTNNVVSITNISAVSGGDISSDGGSSITARGVCWSTSQQPTKDSSHTTDGSGTGLFSSNITNLQPTTIYYVRAYATNNIGTSYGALISFTTINQPVAPSGVPILGTLQVIKSDSNYIGGGYISYDGGNAITRQGICWSTAANPTINNNVINDDSTGMGYFNVNFLLPQTCSQTYYVRAFAQNSFGIAYGQQVTVISGLSPKFASISISNNTGVSVDANVTIIADGGCPITQRGICWSRYSSPTLSPFYIQNGNGIGSYNTTINNLIPNYTYFIRAYAVSSSGTYFGPEITFTTSNTTGLAIGQSYAGGIIFYLDSNRQHGLVCAPQDQINAQWGCQNPDIFIGGTLTSVGSGAQNTAIIVGGCFENSIAAKVCDALVLNGYSDWYLPSKDELNLMYLNLCFFGLGDMFNKTYWSSSEVAAHFAWFQTFSNGVQQGNNSYMGKAGSANIRAIRSF